MTVGRELQAALDLNAELRADNERLRRVSRILVEANGRQGEATRSTIKAHEHLLKAIRQFTESPDD